MPYKLSEIDTHHLVSLQDVGRAVGALRRQAKLSQTALGQAAGLSRMPVYRLEAGQDISLRTLKPHLHIFMLRTMRHDGRCTIGSPLTTSHPQERS